jgi:holo-[acyl-carrier protein] synthase
MILGIGNDLVDMRRIEKTLNARFEARVFTPREMALANSRKARKLATLATRFAAKEAAAKALGSGFRGGVLMRDIECLSGKSGKPELKLHGKALARLHAITPKGKKPVLHVTLSDEAPYAWAFVLIEAV